MDASAHVRIRAGGGVKHKKEQLRDGNGLDVGRFKDDGRLATED